MMLGNTREQRAEETRASTSLQREEDVRTKQTLPGSRTEDARVQPYTPLITSQGSWLLLLHVSITGAVGEPARTCGENKCSTRSEVL